MPERGWTTGKVMFRGPFCITALALFFAIVGTVQGETFTVDDDWEGADFSDIEVALSTVGNGDVLRVHAGEYSKCNWLHISRNDLEVIGNGSDTTLIRPTDHTSFRIDGENVTLRGFSITWEATDDVYHDHILSLQDDYGTLEDLTILNGTIENERIAYGWTFRDCTLMDSPGDSMTLAGSSNELFGCTVVNSTGTGLDIVGSSTVDGFVGIDCAGPSIMIGGMVSLRDCEMIGSGIGIAGNWVLDDLVVENCTLNGRPVIVLHDGSDAVIGENLGQYVLDSCSNITLSGLSETSTIVASNCEDIVVEDSHLGGGLNALDLSGSTNTRLVNLTCDGSKDRDLVAVSCEGIGMFDCSFTSEHGISLGATTDVSMEGCDVAGEIELDWSTEILRTYRIGNVTSNGGPFAMFVNATDVLVEEATEVVLVECRNATVRGFELSSGNGVRIFDSENVSVCDLRMNDTSHSISAFLCTDLEIENCSMENFTSGVSLSDCENVLMNDVDVRNAELGYHHGLSFWHCSNVTLVDTRCVNASYYIRYSTRIDIADSRLLTSDDWYSWYSTRYLDLGNGSIRNTTLPARGRIQIYVDDGHLDFDVARSEMPSGSYYYSSILIFGDDNEIANVSHDGGGRAISIIGNGNHIHDLHFDDIPGFTIDGDGNVAEALHVNGTGPVTIDGDSNEVRDAAFVNRSSMMVSGEGNVIEDTTVDTTDGLEISSGCATFKRCDITGGIVLDEGSIQAYLGSVFIDCTIEGDLPVIIEDQVDPVIPEIPRQLLVFNCTNVTIADREVEMSFLSLNIVGCSNVLLSNVTLVHNGSGSTPYQFDEILGARIDDCDGVRITECVFEDFYTGIDVGYCTDVRIESTAVRGCDNGIYLTMIDVATVRCCTFEDTYRAELEISDVEDTEVHFNDFLGNGHRNDVRKWGMGRSYWWNNYWIEHDHTDGDGDGIADLPYYIDYSQYDYSPLTDPTEMYDGPPGDQDKAPIIELESGTSAIVYYGNSLYIVLTVTEDRGALDRVETRLDGGEWTDLSYGIQRVDMVTYEVAIPIRANDHSKGRHTFEFRAVDDQGHRSVVVETSITIKDPYEEGAGAPIAVDSTFIMQNTFLFIAAVVIVMLLVRTGNRRRREQERRRVAPRLPGDVGRPLSPIGRRPPRRGPGGPQ